MASTVPVQERVVDPFASYNSNVVNKITEVVTQGEEGLLIPSSMQVTADATSPTTAVIVTPGYAIKDDVLINFTGEHRVNIMDDDQFVSPGSPYPEGNYYIVIDYQYQKQRPAPQANVKILKPSERGSLTSGSTYLLLKVLHITAGPGAITAMYDSDPETGYEDNERKYISQYAGAVTTLPTHVQETDQARIAYDMETDSFYFGCASEWRPLVPDIIEMDITLDSTSVSVGDICYINSSGNAALASLTTTTSADLCVKLINSDGVTGKGVLQGHITEANVDSSSVISIGDKLYLSKDDPGKVTNTKTDPYFQSIGRALSAGNSSTPISIIFNPRALLSVVGIRLTGQISSWTLDGGTGFYYNDIDTSDLSSNAYLCSWFDNTTGLQVSPTDVEVRSSGDILRVYFNVNTLTIDYIVQN